MEHNRLLIQALQSGDRMAFESFYRFHYKGVCAYAAQYVSAAEAQELVQEAMLWIWEHPHLLNPERSLKSLLFTMVKNRALNQINRQEIGRKVLDDLAQQFREAFESPDLYLNQELFTLYLQALDSLPAEVRHTFELHRNEHLTHKEIAQKLHISPQTVNYRIGQAMKHLRTQLRDYLPLLLWLAAPGTLD